MQPPRPPGQNNVAAVMSGVAVPPHLGAMPPFVIAAPSRVPLLSGGILAVTAGLAMVSLVLHCLSLSAEPYGYGMNIVDPMSALYAAICILAFTSAALAISAVLACLRRKWEAAYLMAFGGLIILCTASRPRLYGGLLDIGLMLNFVSLISGSIGLVILSSCRRDFAPSGRGSPAEYSGFLLGFRRPILPVAGVGGASPQKFLDAESGREAAGALMLLAGSAMLIISCRSVMGFSSFDVTSQRDEATPSFFILLLFNILGGCAALVSGLFSTRWMRWGVALPAGLLGVLGHISPIFQELVFPVRDYPGYMSFIDIFGTFEWLGVLILSIIAVCTIAATQKADDPIAYAHGSG